MTPLLVAMGQHIALAYGGWLISAVLRIAGGVLALKNPWLKSGLLMGTSLLQAIPAIALALGADLLLSLLEKRLDPMENRDTIVTPVQSTYLDPAQ